MRRFAAATIVMTGFLGLLGGTSAYAADSCPNAAYRNGAGANLPDCRAWEQVTPVDKGGNQVRYFEGVFPSPDGNTVLSPAAGDLSGADGISIHGLFASNRGESWITGGLDAPFDSSPTTNLVFQPALGFSDDKSKALVVTTRKLTADAAEGASNLYVRDTRTRAFSLAASVPGRALFDDLIVNGISDAFYGADPDFTYIVIKTNVALDANAPNGGLYSISGGRVRLISQDTSGAALSALRGFYPGPDNPLVSRDGKRVTFAAFNASFDRVLYQRVNDASTVLLSRSLRAGGNPDEGVAIISPARPSADGRSGVFQTASAATLTNSGPPSKLFRWSDGGNTLTNLFADVADPPSSDASVDLLRVSSDERYVWFIQTDLDANGFPGEQRLKVLDTARKEVSTKATAPSGETVAGEPQLRFSPDGTKLAAVSASELTGYDQTGPNCTPRCAELFAYDAKTPNSLPVCVSCGVPGSHSDGDARVDTDGRTVSRPLETVVTNDGRVYFDTPSRLVAGDANGLRDVYESVPGRRPALISSGTGQYPANVVGPTPSSNDVFFTTADALVPQDQDGGATDVYVARVGGGLASQQRTTAKADPCASANCPGLQPVVPGAEAPGTATFVRPAGAATFRAARVSAAARRKAAASGRLGVAVRVSAAGRLSARATARSGKRVVTIGRDLKSVRTGGRVTLALSLSRAARRTLARAGTLKVSLSVSYSRASEPQSQTFTLRKAQSSAKGGAR